MITLVCASRLTPEAFAKSPLGLTIRPKRLHGVESVIFYNNTRGLSEVYNEFLTPQFADRPILFVHDDVYLEDYWLAQRVTEAVAQFDVVGLAGQSFYSSVTSVDQPSHSHWDIGAVAMGTTPETSELHNQEHGGAPRNAFLIDGFFLALDTKRVIESGVRLDPQFEFVFYDRDFSRTAFEAGLAVGVAPIAVTHQSGVMVPGTERYRRECELYVNKWKGRS